MGDLQAARAVWADRCCLAGQGMHPGDSAMAADTHALAGTLAFQRDAQTYGALRACHCCLPFYTWVLSRHSARPGVQHTRRPPLFSAGRRAGLSAGRVLSQGTNPHTEFHLPNAQLSPNRASCRSNSKILRRSAPRLVGPGKPVRVHSPAAAPFTPGSIRLPVNPLRIDAGPQENRCLPHHQKGTPVKGPRAASHARYAPARQSESTLVR